MVGNMFLKGAFKYAVMPGIMPRTRNLLAGGLGYVPFFIAVVYQMVGLLPRNHPYLAQHNIGRYGVRHVVAEAASNVVFSFKNIDQIILFAAVLAGMVIFLVQIFTVFVLLMFQPVYAIPTNWAGFFTTSLFGVPVLALHDLAYMMLDMVFGVPNATIFGIPLPGGFFNSCVGLPVNCFDNNGTDIADLAIPGASPIAGEAGRISVLGTNASGSFPFPYHDGLHRLFGVYSTGLLVIAVGILSYFVATVLAETAQSGTPFGRRFNKTWAPLRIVVAFGLLMPLTVGLNSAQYLVLYAAKYGSAFASNGWRYFNITLTVSYNSGLGENLVAVPNAPELQLLPAFMFVAKTCKVVYESKLLENNGNPALTTTPSPFVDETVRMYVVHATTKARTAITPGYSYTDFVTNTGVVGTDPSGGSMSIPIIFGNVTEEGVNDLAGIHPVCGQLKFTFQDARLPLSAGGEGQEGPSQVQETYFNVLRDLWHENVWTGAAPYDDVAAPTPAYTATANRRHEYYAEKYAEIDVDPARVPLYLRGPTDFAVDNSFVQFVNATVRKEIEDNIASAVADQNASGAWDLDLTTSGEVVLYLRGWAGAGIWYNRISQLNGQTVAAVYGVPSITTFPLVMEDVASLKTQNDNGVIGDEAFKPELSNVDSMVTQLGTDGSAAMANALYHALTDWNRNANNSSVQVPSDNPVLSFISQIFGIDGLYSMRKNPSTHPLAMLAGIGRSLVESSIRATTYALALTGIGALASQADVPAAYTSVPANFLVMVATLGLTVGFVLFYIVPFLPFIYFFFAVGGWIKGIFEAMVGAPLWALAHIRIDGNGLPGNAAMNGYFLIFEVFLRPILILFGMLASISIYSALVSVLHDVFPLLANNVGGYDLNSEISIPTGQTTLNVARGQIDEFFYTVIYAIIVYIMGMASFKLIDMIPNNILRWMGQSVATFGDQREDPAQNMVSKATIGSQQAVSRLGGGLNAVVNMNK